MKRVVLRSWVTEGTFDEAGRFKDRNFGIHYGVRIIVKLAALTGYLYLGMKMGVLTRENYLLVKNMIVPAKNNPGFIG